MDNLQLIKPNKNNQVTARNLHDFLGLSKNQISRWFKKTIINNGFAIEGEDYQGFDTVVEGNTIQDFYLSLDFAKKIAMQAKSEMGEQARNYFLECEKKLKQPKQLSTLDILRLATQELEKKEEENRKLAQENTTLASRQLEVKTQKEYKWVSKEIQNDRGRTINYYVAKHFFDGDYRSAHQKAKQAYRQATGVMLPDKASLMSQEQKLDYLQFLSRM